MVFMTSWGLDVVMLLSPILAPTTRVTTAMLMVWPMERMVDSTEDAMP